MNLINAEPAWRSHLNIASRSFRLGMEAAGSESLMRFIDAIAPILQLLSPDVVQQLGGVLNKSLSAQARRDYSYLADLLEYQIRPLLEGAEEQIQQADMKGQMNDSEK